MSLCHERQCRGNFLWPSIPNQRLKIIVLVRRVVVVDVRTVREITIWILSRQSPRRIHSHSNPIHLEIINTPTSNKEPCQWDESFV